MNDPWDVKSVLRAGQYVSCMKINGVPLLPPVLSRECREEMTYYKILAREVEKRLVILKPLVQDDPEPSIIEDSPENYTKCSDLENKIEKQSPTSKLNVTKLIDAENVQKIEVQLNKPKNNDDIPERDYNVAIKSKQEDIVDTNIKICSPKLESNLDVLKDMLLEGLNTKYISKAIERDGPASFSSKSFTGSLNDIHSESKKEVSEAKLVRQRSYTVLTPSPQLLAHLEVQSLSTGVEMTSISMSESLSNLTPRKKRRNWDLESAKMKWSNMAMELNKKNYSKDKSRTFIFKPEERQCATPKHSLKSNLLFIDKGRRSSLSHTTSKRKLNKSNTAPAKLSGSPISNTIYNKVEKLNGSDLTQILKREPNQTNTPQKNAEIFNKIECEDPATQVRILYEKVQKQQLMQMATLVEKQKKEQLLLQQVFEQQNSLLYKQLKSICPTSPVQVKEAWPETNDDSEEGLVSLSQLINYKPVNTSPQEKEVVSTTLTDTNNYLNQCNDALKKSRNITRNLQHNLIKPNYVVNQTSEPKAKTINSNNHRNLSPNRRNGNNSKIGQYDTSSPSDREYEDPILTDRTNDTLADLNFTFTDDSGTENNNNNNTCIFKVGSKSTNQTVNSRSTTNSLLKSQNSTRKGVGKKLFDTKVPTTREQAAATKIVAFAKGFLVRRLLRTERVQEIVQTIRDALLCALQLHQDREGIRGADVDLHRRLIQQITAACYNLHDTFVSSSPTERCAIIAADRARKRALASRQSTPVSRRHSARPTDVMSQSHSGVFSARMKRTSIPANMSQSNYETFSGSMNKRQLSTSELNRPRPRPWR